MHGFIFVDLILCRDIYCFVCDIKQGVHHDIHKHNSDPGACGCVTEGHPQDGGISVADISTTVLFPTLSTGYPYCGSAGQHDYGRMCK